MGFMNLEKIYDRVNKKASRHVLRMYGMGGKLLSEINNKVC